MMGAERRSMVMSEKEKRNTAYHEAGHTIVGALGAGARSGLQGHASFRAVARLGVTMFLPEEDRYSISQQKR